MTKGKEIVVHALRNAPPGGRVRDVATVGSEKTFQGPVSHKPRKKPFLVHQYLRTEKCTRLKRLVLREPLFIIILRISEYTAL